MVSPLPRESTIDLTAEPLGAGWLRRHPTSPETREIAGPGVWRSGPMLRFRDELVTALEHAEEIALLSSFLLAEERLAEAMLRATRRGVRAYVLTASEQRIGKVVRDEDSFEQRMADQHKALLDRLAGNVLLRSAEHIHAKFLVVDPHSSTGARAWLSTANFNKALEDSIELGVRLDPARARALAGCFYWAFWCEAERELRSPGRLLEIRQRYPAVPARPNDDAVFATLGDDTRLRDKVLGLIDGARAEILAASYGIAADHPAVRALINAAKRGVRVTVVTRPRPAVSAGVAALVTAGISVVAHDKLHAKALVVDGQAFVMSANLDAQGLDTGFEVGAVLPPESALGVEETLRDWTRTFPWVYRSAATRGEHVGDFCPADAGLRDGVVRVVESHLEHLPPVVANDALALDQAPTPAFKPVAPSRTLPQHLKFFWDVVPPTLPPGAVQRLEEAERGESTNTAHDPPLHEYQGQLFVVLREGVSVERAREIARERGAKVVLP